MTTIMAHVASTDIDSVEDFCARWEKAWNDHDGEAVATLCADDLVHDEPALGETAHGTDPIRTLRPEVPLLRRHSRAAAAARRRGLPGGRLPRRRRGPRRRRVRKRRPANVTDGLALDSGGDVASGANLKQWAWDGSPNLQWQAVELGDGHYKLVNIANGMVADGWGDSGNGAAARQAPWNGGSNQQWTITHRGDGRYSIANRTTGLVLDGGGNVASGSLTKQWTYDGSTNLMWTFTAL